MSRIPQCRREAKVARRRRRTSGPTRGKARGPVTRAGARAELMGEGEGRLMQMSTHVGQWLDRRGLIATRVQSRPSAPAVRRLTLVPRERPEVGGRRSRRVRRSEWIQL